MWCLKNLATQLVGNKLKLARNFANICGCYSNIVMYCVMWVSLLAFSKPDVSKCYWYVDIHKGRIFFAWICILMRVNMELHICCVCFFFYADMKNSKYLGTYYENVTAKM